MGAAITKPELPKTEKWSIIERLNKEKECIGMYISSHPLDEYKVVFQQVCNTTTAQLSSDLESFYGKKIIFGGMVTDAWDAVSSKTGKPFGKMVLNDYTGSYELAFFSKDYIDFNKFLAKNLYLLVVATVQKKGEDWKFYKLGIEI
jgi:DNA polymerase-3 subunit alpha